MYKNKTQEIMMNLKKIYQTNIIEAEISGMFAIYETIYNKKNIGKPERKWRDDLKKLYHGHVKIVYLLQDETESSLVGYAISAGIVRYENTCWEKILEGGVRAENHLENKKFFKNMLEQIINGITPNYITEIGVKDRIMPLMNEIGFKRVYDESLCNFLMKDFLGHNSFALERTNHGLVIHRKTAVNEDYSGQLLTFSQ